MTDIITAEEAGKLLDGTTPGPWWKRDCDVVVGEGLTTKTIGHFWPHWSNDEKGIEQTEPNAALTAAAPDLARIVIALHAQLADAKAAQAMVVERVAEACRIALDARADRYGVETRGAIGDSGLYAIDAIRALADTDGLALVQALRAERDRWHGLASDNGRAALDHLANIVALEADRDRLAAANAALEAQVARLVGARPTLNWCRAEGQTIHEMRVNLQSSPFGQALIDMGDCALVWANEGDLYQFYATLAEVQADARPEGGE